MTTTYPEPRRESPDVALRPRADARVPIAGRGYQRRTLDVVVAVVASAFGLFLISGYPLGRTVPAVLFVGWVAFAAWRLDLALTAAIALIPVVGLAFWTGWLTFEETDLLVLATASGGFLARALFPATKPTRGDASLSIVSLCVLALLLASNGVSLERGIVAASGWHFDFVGNYYDAGNSVRIFKSFALALLVAPLVVGELRRAGGIDRVGLGMTIGLGLCGLAVLQERIAFTGVLSFSEDYRVTAPFWEMHTGGAALDGYLALTIPFAIREALRTRRPARFVGALAVLALAAYAVLVTFSRGVYVAVPMALVILAVLTMRQRLQVERRTGWWLVARGVGFAIVVALMSAVVFRHGGFRALLAAIGVVVLAIPVDAAMRRARVQHWLAAALLAAVVACGGWLVGDLLPKGPYLVFAAAFVATAAMAWWEETQGPRAPAIVTIASWLWLVAAAVHVAAFWGGPSARDASALALGAVAIVLVVASRFATPLWPTGRRERLGAVAVTGLVAAAVTVFMAGAYMSGRFSTSDADLRGRLEHWRDSLARLHRADWLLGKGLGRYPASSLFEAADGSSPGRGELVEQNGERFLALSTTKMKYVDYQVWFREVQRVFIAPDTNYLVTLKARAATTASLHVELCEQQLLYAGECRMTYFPINGGNAWSDYSFRLDSGNIGRWRGLATRPVFLEIANRESAAVIDLRSIHVIGPDGRDVVANGDFADGMARWFSTSNRSHLPWHVKNIFLGVMFDQGVFGLLAFAMVTGGAWLRTAAGRARRHPDAPFVAAAIAGYLIVGLFDTLLDVPRVGFLFYVVVIAGLALRAPRAVANARTNGTAVPVPQASTFDSERARRRQAAFGTRGPPNDRLP